MGLNSSYLLSTKKLPIFFDSLITAQPPKTFTLKFLESLEFKTTSDRLYVALLKGLGFLDPNGAPTDLYFQFLDQTQSKRVLAEAIKKAYGDIFAVNIKAHTLNTSEVRNKLKTLTQGKNSERVVAAMASTFVALCQYAEWDAPPVKEKIEKAKIEEEKELEKSKYPENPTEDYKPHRTQLHYNIQIHLPETRDESVYEAIFKSLKKHLF